MYPNYIEDRKALGYEAVIDTTCGKSLRILLRTQSIKLKE